MDIENDKPAPVFFDTPKEPAKRTRKKTDPKPVDHVLDNLKMLGLIAKKSGTIQQTHIRINNEFAYACEEALTFGCPLPFPVNAVVNHHELLEAKKAAGFEFACTSVGHQLAIVANDLKMIVSTDHSETWTCPQADPSIAPATDALRAALSDCVPFATATGRPNIEGVLCQGGTAVATNGMAIIESYHGIDMPPNLRIPVVFIKKLEKIKRKIVSFGFSQSSFTVWFEDGSFLRTAMYHGEYISYHHLFANEDGFELVDLPTEFYKTLKQIKPFAKNGVVYLKDGRIHTSRDEESASSFHHPGIPNGFGFNIDLLLLITNHGQTVKFMNNCDRIMYENGNVRGIVMALDLKPAKQIAKPQESEDYSDNFEDDIPF